MKREGDWEGIIATIAVFIFVSIFRLEKWWIGLVFAICIEIFIGFMILDIDLEDGKINRLVKKRIPITFEEKKEVIYGFKKFMGKIEMILFTGIFGHIISWKIGLIIYIIAASLLSYILGYYAHIITKGLNREKCFMMSDEERKKQGSG